MDCSLLCSPSSRATFSTDVGDFIIDERMLKHRSEFLYVFVTQEERGFRREKYHLLDVESKSGIAEALRWMHHSGAYMQSVLPAAAIVSLIRWDVKFCGMTIYNGTDEQYRWIFTHIENSIFSPDMV
jgi:hypothetical protein